MYFPVRLLFYLRWSRFIPIVNALLLDQSIRLLCKGHLDAAPEWLRWLSSLSLCAGFLMFFLSLWLAMHASVASHSFATRLLTQYVRLPIPSDKQLDALQLRFDEFEGYKARDMLRVPLIKVAAKKLEASLKASSSKKRKSEGGVRFPFFGSLLRKNNASGGAGAAAVPAGEGRGDRQAATAAPTSSAAVEPHQHWRGSTSQPELQQVEEDGVGDEELQQAEQIEVTSLEHVKLYRRMQANFISYDAYARAGTSIGLNSFLFSLWYFCLGIATETESQAQWASWGCCLVMAVNVLLVAKIDFDLGGRSFGLVALLIVLPAIFSTVAVTLYRWHMYAWHVYFVLLVFLFHIFWGAVVLYLVKAGTDEQVKLPHQFKQVLYLDVFGQWGGFSEGSSLGSRGGGVWAGTGEHRGEGGGSDVDGGAENDDPATTGALLGRDPADAERRSQMKPPETPTEQYLHAYLSVCSLRRLCLPESQVEVPADVRTLVASYESVAKHLLEPLDGNLIPLVCISLRGAFVDNVKKNKDKVACLYDPVTKVAIIPGVTRQQQHEQQRVCLPLARLRWHLRELTAVDVSMRGSSSSSGGRKEEISSGSSSSSRAKPEKERPSDCAALFEEDSNSGETMETRTATARRNPTGAAAAPPPAGVLASHGRERETSSSWDYELRQRIVHKLGDAHPSAISGEEEKLRASQEPLFNNRFAERRIATAAENTVVASCAFFPVNNFDRIRRGPDWNRGETFGDGTLGDEEQLLQSASNRCWANEMRPGNVPWFMFLVSMLLFMATWVLGFVWYCTHININADAAAQVQQVWAEIAVQRAARGAVWAVSNNREPSETEYGSSEEEVDVGAAGEGRRGTVTTLSRVAGQPDGRVVVIQNGWRAPRTSNSRWGDGDGGAGKSVLRIPRFGAVGAAGKVSSFVVDQRRGSLATTEDARVHMKGVRDAAIVCDSAMSASSCLLLSLMRDDTLRGCRLLDAEKPVASCVELLKLPRTGSVQLQAFVQPERSTLRTGASSPGASPSSVGFTIPPSGDVVAAYVFFNSTTSTRTSTVPTRTPDEHRCRRTDHRGGRGRASRRGRGRQLVEHAPFCGEEKSFAGGAEPSASSVETQTQTRRRRKQRNDSAARLRDVNDADPLPETVMRLDLFASPRPHSNGEGGQAGKGGPAEIMTGALTILPIWEKSLLPCDRRLSSVTNFYICRQTVSGDRVGEKQAVFGWDGRGEKGNQFTLSSWVRTN